MGTAVQTFAARLNSFAGRSVGVDKPTVLDLARRAASVKGLTHLDFNYPDHLTVSPRVLSKQIEDIGLKINGFAMRYYTNPAFKLGAFTNPDRNVRKEAIELTKRGIDAARETGSDLMTIWLGQDGFDYPFQVDYRRLWDDEVSGIAEVASHDPGCNISIEYKPNEPRSFSVLPDCSTTLLAIDEAGTKNLGVTLDFAHVLYADEQPAFAAAMIANRSKLYGVHLNDGYAKRDDGLMVASVHYIQTLELLLQIERDKYRGVIYFDTFPDASGLNPEYECAQNISITESLLKHVQSIGGDNRLSNVLAQHDAVAAQRLVQSHILK